MRPPARESVYWVNIKTDFENVIKRCSTGLEFQATQLKDKPLPHDLSGKLWKTVGADMFITFKLNHKTYFLIVDYHSKFSVMKLKDGHGTDSLIKMCRIIFAYTSSKNNV